jgi:IMP dehydrogenase
MNQTIAFDDVLLIPQYSDIQSRKEIDLSSRLDEYVKLELPIISSCMDTVTESEMALALNVAGGIGIIHRYNTIEQQVQIFKESKGTGICAIGVGDDLKDRVLCLAAAGCSMFCIDVAHGHHILVKQALEYLKSEYSDFHFMAGNVATHLGYDDLVRWGANSVRVGIGGGCFVPGTEVMTENGLKKIEEIQVGEKVYSHDGTLKPVVDTMKFFRDEEIMVVNDIECTKNHEFYVIEKKDVHLVNENNIQEFAKWIEASELDKEKFLLVEVQ